jgi:serine/threonine protein kinase
MTTQRPGQRLVKEANAEPIPGYRLLEPLGKGGFGEVWKCEAPGGLCKAIKFVQGDDSALTDEPSAAEQELRALQHVKSIRHPFLLSIDRVEHVAGELVIVTELADRSLHDLLEEHVKAGNRGIPRADLLGYLKEAAEVLDLMNHEHGLQHLDIKPRNLFLVHQHVKVADFGLVNSLGEMNGEGGLGFKLAAMSPIYASPETFQGRITLYSDQYSLAIVYCELLTGQLPFAGKNFRQLAMQHTSVKPNLAALAEHDREIVGRALAKEPGERFPSCTEFIQTLASAEVGEPLATVPSGKATRVDIDIAGAKKTAVLSRPTRVVAPLPPSVRPSESGEDREDALTLDAIHYLDCLGRTPLGELWKVELPDGEPRLLKLINTFSQEMGEESAAGQLRAIRHRGLLPSRVVPHSANRLAILTPPVKESLASRLQETVHRGQAGIPRLELLGYLLTAARTLDELQKLHGLQHLGLNPRNLLLVEGELKLSDFGLMALVWIPGGQSPSQINPRYCAPELFQRRLSRQCDQYSLALIFYEMLTGDHLHGSRTASQLARVRNDGVNSLDLVSALDRPAMSRALHPEPGQRFPSAVDFIHALLEITPGGEDLLTQDGWSGVEQVVSQHETVKEDVAATIRVDTAAVEKLLSGIVRDLTGDREIREYRSAPYYYRPGIEIEHRCYARIVQGTLRLKLSGFAEQWGAKTVERQEDRFRYQMSLRTSLWRRMLGSQPALEIEVRAGGGAGATVTEVCLFLRPVSCSAQEGAEALEKWGPQLIDSLRTHLQVGRERRKFLRLPFERTLRVRAIQGSHPVGDEMECQGKDISLGGMGIRLPVKPPSQLLLRLSRGGSDEPMDIPANVVRCSAGVGGLYEVGLQFALEE